jgi:hypothetical protein
MENISNLKNPISSSVKGRITITEAEQQSPKTRGEVAAQKQMRGLRQALLTDVGSRAPFNRGEVAAQEQMKIVQHVAAHKEVVAAHKEVQSREPRSRGEVGKTECSNSYNNNYSTYDSKFDVRTGEPTKLHTQQAVQRYEGTR